MAINTADGSVVIGVDMNVSQAEKKFNKLTDNIEKSEKKINDITQKRDAAEKKGIFDAATLDAEKAKLQSLKDTLADLKATTKDKSLSVETREYAAASIPEAKENLAEQQARVRSLQSEYDKLENSVSSYNTQLAEAENHLEIQKTEAGALAEQIDKANGPAAKFGKKMKDAGDGVSKLENRIKKLASKVLIFSTITMGLRGMREWIGNVIKGNDEARKSMAQLKGALLTLAQPLVNIVIPAFITLVNVLTKAVAAIAGLVSKVFGTTVEKSAEAAKKLNDEQKALKGVGSAAKKASKQVAAFDEINQIGDQDAGASGASAAATDIEPDFSEAIKGQISGIAEFLTGMALVALGAILTFTGVAIPVGLALMVAGAAMVYGALSENWGAMEQALQGPIGAVVALVSVALLAIGAILAFSGVNLPLGIALIALGAVGLATTAKANWSTISNALKGEIGAIVLLVSTALLAIGAILAFSGVNIALGIALIAAGALGLIATAAANWNSMDEALQGPIGVVVALVGGALLALGAILAFSGANIPLGIALLVAGSVSLAATISANWDTIKEKLQGPIGAVVAIVSSALLVLGIILLFTGAGIPLGLGLIAAGAIGLAATITANWDFILDKLKGIWESVKNWWNTKVVPPLKAIGRFFADWIINPILAGVEGFINFFIKGLNWLIDKLNLISFETPDWIPFIGGKKFGFNVPSIGEVSLPRLATGAVIPPNREFMAVLGDQKRGTNIEAPADLIRSIVREEIGRSNSESGDIKIVFDGDLAALARILNPHIEREQRRMGANFVSAGYSRG